ncbi:interferon-related developmental regulator-domain-containing protein [Lophiotrema nucula]|uniref:Interferon-related developmental regulator-domain-containing protein n=1 Tax=Lophiotrema nucula TaxID=690887 RepID=A0A6A5YVL9_9PLEO|nr:interferon-related developmental regulator-domain-containing protein [Lophiotrema nucula]
MHDLRRQALENGKTVSRKARSRQVSTASSKANSNLNSPAQSRANSRNPSRHGSDDEEYLSDGTAWSTNSIEDILNGEDVDLPSDAWKAELQNTVEQIVDRKRSSTEGRADSLSRFAHICMARFAKDDIESHMGELLPSMLRSIKQETTERETVNALKALSVAIITLDSDDIYDSVADQLKRTISDSESIQAKISAIHALGVAAFFGGASEDESEDVMTYLLEIIESDGLSVDAHDEGSVVVAALEEWGLLATGVEDIEETTEAAIEAFVDQLQSSDAGVQIAAGENIALLYEKSYTPREEDEDISEEDVDSEDEEQPSRDDKLVKRYTVYRRQDQLLHTLDDLATISTRKISKKDRKTLHSSFADIRNSVEKPTRGPKYSTALDQETGRSYGGGRMKVRINRNVEVRIDKWWKLQRLNALRRVLQGGFTHQYDENEAVSRCLPFSVAGKR